MIFLSRRGLRFSATLELFGVGNPKTTLIAYQPPPRRGQALIPKLPRDELKPRYFGDTMSDRPENKLHVSVVPSAYKTGPEADIANGLSRRNVLGHSIALGASAGLAAGMSAGGAEAMAKVAPAPLP